VNCYWFTIDATDARSTQWAYGCPEDFVPDDERIADLLQTCATPLENVRFDIGDDGQNYDETNDAGAALFDAVIPGPLTFTESPPPDYSAAVVFCRENFPGAPDTDRARVETDGLSITQEVAGGNELECYWFNYQAPPATPTPAEPSPTPSPSPSPSPTPTQDNGGSGGNGGTGGNGGSGGSGGNGGGQPSAPDATPDPDDPASLVLTAHTCPAGYDLHASAANPAEDCEDLANGIAFSLAADGEDEPRTGDDSDARVTFDDLKAGSYLLAASFPAEVQTAFIAGCESDRRDFPADHPFTPFAYAGPDGQIGVNLVPGETLECGWYDVPAPGVTLLAFDCPGAQANVAACAPSGTPASLTLTPDGPDGEPITLAADETGSGMLPLQPGSYQLGGIPDDACLIDSAAIDAGGKLNVAKGEPVEIRVYVCGE
jgi:hypothetical protein